VTIDNFGDRLRADAAAAMVRYDNGYRACAIDPIGCDRSYLTEVATPRAVALLNTFFDKRIADHIRRRPNPDPDLDYMVVENVEFAGDFDHAKLTICSVDGSARIHIGDTAADVAVINDDLGGSRGIAEFAVQTDGKWKYVDYTQTELFDGTKPTCAPRPHG
jgi:hypothetical protein